MKKLIAILALSVCSCVAHSGNEEAKRPKEDSTAALFPVEQNSKWGFINRTGKIVITPQFEGAGVFSEGLAIVQIGGKWGYIDTTGRAVIVLKFFSCDAVHKWMGIGESWDT